MVRQAGSNPENTRFRELLLRLRDGCTTREDWELLLTRTPTNVPNLADFKDATHLFYKKEDVTKFNITKLSELSSPKQPTIIAMRRYLDDLTICRRKLLLDYFEVHIS